MPNRYVEIPEAVTLADPSTGQPILGDDNKPTKWDFAFVMNKLLSNPLWGESFAAMRSQDAITQALEDVRDGILTLAEDDWQRLKQAVEFPKTTISTPVGAQTVQGFGVHPALARQLVRLLAPIMDAKAEKPKVRAVHVVDAPAPAPAENLS